MVNKEKSNEDFIRKINEKLNLFFDMNDLQSKINKGQSRINHHQSNIDLGFLKISILLLIISLANIVLFGLHLLGGI